MTAAPAKVPTHHELLDERTRLKPLRVEHYHRLIESGILEEGEPYELLDGQLICKDRGGVGDEPMTVGLAHAFTVRKLAQLQSRLADRGCFMQTQQPVSLPPFDEPEPDGALVRGEVDAYHDHHPAAADLLCVIEVAEASLRRDRTTKRAIYARAGVSCYVIVNLIDRQSEVYTQPLSGEGRYVNEQVIPRGGEIELPTPTSSGRLTLAVDDLLPA